MDARRGFAAHLEEINRLSDCDQTASIINLAFVLATTLLARLQLVWPNDLSSLHVIITNLDVFRNHVVVVQCLKIGYLKNMLLPNTGEGSAGL